MKEWKACSEQVKWGLCLQKTLGLAAWDSLDLSSEGIDRAVVSVAFLLQLGNFLLIYRDAGRCEHIYSNYNRETWPKQVCKLAFEFSCLKKKKSGVWKYEPEEGRSHRWRGTALSGNVLSIEGQFVRNCTPWEESNTTNVTWKRQYIHAGVPTSRLSAQKDHNVWLLITLQALCWITLGYILRLFLYSNKT